MALTDLQKAFLRDILISKDNVIDSATGAPLDWSSLGAGSAQPLDSDLTSIAALATTSYGRNLLTLANQAALQAAVGALLSQAATGPNVTAPGNLTATSYTDLDATNLKKTVSGVGPFFVFAQVLVASVNNSDRLRLTIAVDGTNIFAAGGLWISPSSAAYAQAAIVGASTGVLSAGSHTVALQGKVGAGTTAVFDGQVSFLVLG